MWGQRLGEIWVLPEGRQYGAEARESQGRAGAGVGMCLEEKMEMQAVYSRRRGGSMVQYAGKGH